MVGRTPEYLGKKIEAYEMKMASIMVLIPVTVVLVGTAVAVLSAAGKATIFNPVTFAGRSILIRRAHIIYSLSQVWVIDSEYESRLISESFSRTSQIAPFNLISCNPPRS